MLNNADFSERPSKIFINLAALEENYKNITEYVAPAKVMAVLKANAYGHGLIECAQKLESAGVDYFGVALVEEGEVLRQAGIKKPIHVFGGILGSQIDRFLKSDLELTASSLSKLKSIDQVAGALGIRARVHIKVDTGMGRIGVRPESADELFGQCQNLKNTKVVGVFSHLAASDEPDTEFTKSQIEQFLSVADKAKRELGKDLLAHISNSAAILAYPEANLDLVRPGLILYGICPARHLAEKLSLKAVMSIKSRVVYFKVVRAGQTVSYSRTWKSQTDTRVVTVPIGYGDGYPRSLSNKASVIINGHKYPVIGRICMDQLMVDIGQDSVFNDDSVVIIGSDRGSSVSVEELAELADTVPHEILSNFNLRMPRNFIN